MPRPAAPLLLAIALAACRPAELPVAPGIVEVRAAPAPEVDEEHRPLADLEVDNLVAFTRLLGYVRWFHPSDGALVADWDGIAVAGARRALGAGTPKELARVLGEVFRGVAPTLVVHLAGSEAAVPPELLPPQGGPAPVIVAWRHDGLGAGTGGVYASRRVNDRPPELAEPGALVQVVDAKALRGKRVKVRAAVRAEVAPGAAAEGGAGEPGAGALFGLRVTLPGGLEGLVDEMEDRPITAREWRRYEVAGDVDAEAESLSIGLRLRGEGRAFVDDVSLQVVGEKGDEAVTLANPGFEEGAPGEVPPGWTTADAGERTGYRVAISAERPLQGKGSGAIASVRRPAEALPPPSQTLRADLGAGVVAEVPLTLYFADGGTLPRAPWPDDRRRPRGPFAHDPRDRATRLAAVAVLWSALQHFYPDFDVVAVDWAAELRAALARAAVDKDERASLGTLRRMMAAIHDGHGGVVLERRDEQGALVSFEHDARRLPLIWDWIEGRLVVTAVRFWSLPKLRPGDVIAAIDGVPAQRAVEAALAEVSAATPQHARLRALDRLAVAPGGTSVLLSVEPRVGPPYTLRAVVDLPIGRPPWVWERRPAPVEAVEPGIVYIDLDRVGEEAFEQAVPKLAAARGIVIDLRGQGHVSLAPLRHLAATALEGPRAHVPRIARPDREGMGFTLSTWSLPPAAPRFGAKVAFLADARSAGQVEALLGIVAHHRLGEIVGAPTAGADGAANRIALPGGFAATFTGTRVLKHDGARRRGVGIAPTIPVSRTIAGVAAGVDEVLESALAAVRDPAP